MQQFVTHSRAGHGLFVKFALLITVAIGYLAPIGSELDGALQRTMGGEGVQSEKNLTDNQCQIVEVRIGFLAGRQRPLNETIKSHPLYSSRLQRILMLVFEYALDKVNRDLALQVEHIHKQNDATNATTTASSTNLVQIKLRPVIVETFGNEKESVKQTMDLILNHRVHAVVGPAQERCQLEWMIATVFNVPMVSYHCSPRGPFETMTILKDQVDEANDDCDAHQSAGDKGEQPMLSGMRNNEAHWQQFAAMNADAVQTRSTLVQVKPPSWKIAGQVIALVGRLLDLNNSYPRQLVLLYFENKQLRPSTNQTESRGGALRATNEQQATNQREAHEHSAEALHWQMATSDQYKTIGRLLEMKLVQLLRNRRRAEFRGRRKTTAAANQRAVEQSTLTVLNWHTTYHSGYTKNPFRRLIRRHLLQRTSGRADYQFDDNENGDRQRQQCDVLGRPKSDIDQGNKSWSSSAVQRPPSESIYIIVGHYYEHLGLMQALDELGLFAFDGWTTETSQSESFVSGGDKERPEFVNDEGGGGQSARSELTKPADEPQRESGQRVQQHQQRHRSTRPTTGAKSEEQKRRPTIVIGVDIEPHDDERDDSVPFLRGLLMDAKSNTGTIGLGLNGAGSASTIAANGGANEHEINQAVGDVNSPVSMYNHYIGVVPTKPSKSLDLLDEVRHFHNRASQQQQRTRQAQQSSDANNDTPTNDASDGSHQLSGDGRRQSIGAKINQTSVHDGHLDHLTLKLALLPIEANYLYDSIVLLADYFSGCLRNGSSLGSCSQGERVVNWFANRLYSSYVADGPTAGFVGSGRRESRFDRQARAEGLYSLMARRVPLTSSKSPVAGESDQQQYDGAPWSSPSSSADDEFDIATVGRFVAKCSSHPIEFSASPSSVSKVWWPLWCDALRAEGAPLGNDTNWFELICSSLLEQSKSGNQSREDLGEGSKGGAQRSARSLISLCLFVCFLIAFGLITWALFCKRTAATRLRSNIFHLNCLSRGERSTEWRNLSWFNETDAKNFLQIVNNLLLPSSADGQDDYDDSCGLLHETANVDDNDEGGGVELDLERTCDDQRESDELEQITTSGLSCLRWRPLKRQQHAEDEVGIRQPDSRRRPVELLEAQRPDPAPASAATTQAIDLHCYMFPFPSCKFVHWLAALHTLKEMLFKYQSNMGSSIDMAPAASRATFSSVSLKRRASEDSSSDGSFSLPCWNTKSRLMFQLPILFKRQMPATSTGESIQGIGYDNRRCCLATSLATEAAVKQSDFEHSDNCRARRRRDQLARFGGINSEAGSWFGETQWSCSELTHFNRTFFTGHHKGSATVRLLLSKYKATNEHLCHLAKLNHRAIVKLFGITLTNARVGRNKLVQMIVEATERGNLRQELAMLESNRHINAQGCASFKPILWRNWLIDLTNGLEYLHVNSPIGFHGRLCATTCLVTNNWHLKLSGFHVDYMRRSLGGYEMKQSTNTFNNICEAVAEQQPDAYAAPELLAMRNSRGQLLSGQAMKLADVYSLGYVAYELLVGHEPWACLAQCKSDDDQSPLAASTALPDGNRVAQDSMETTLARQRHLKLLTERVRVDPSFRPPIVRLDNIVPILRRAFECAGATDPKCATERALHQCEPQISRPPPQSSAGVTVDGYATECELNRSLLMDYDGNFKSELIRASLLSAVRATKSLLESCWAQMPRDRPQSVTQARRLLNANLLKCLSQLASLQKNRQRRLQLKLNFDTKLVSRGGIPEQDSTLVLYTRLVEVASMERLEALQRQIRISSELRFSLLPESVVRFANCHFQSTASQNQPVASIDEICLCMFRVLMIPVAGCGGPTNQRLELNKFGVLNRFLDQLDELICSFRGHLHVWDSQVDSLMRFTVCAGNLSLSSAHSEKPSDDVGCSAADKIKRSLHRRSSLTTYSHTRLVTTFALELIDMVNRFQTKCDIFLQLKCALHEGSIIGGLILPRGACKQNERPQTVALYKRTTLLKQARFVPLGQTIQTLDVLEQTCPPQKIQISCEMRAKLLELPEEKNLITVAGDQEAFSLNLIPALLRGSSAEDGPLLQQHQQQQQGYILMRRVNKIKVRNTDLDTYWLLNGPRVTSSQRLMLPLLLSDGVTNEF